MNSENIYDELISIANENLKEIEQILPKDPIHCFTLFTEMTRVYDFYSINTQTKISKQELDIITIK